MTRQQKLENLVDDLRKANVGDDIDLYRSALRALAWYVSANIKRITIASGPEDGA